MIREFFDVEIKAMFSAYSDVKGTGLYFGIYLLLILYFLFFVKDETKEKRTFFGIYPVVALLIVWNPIFAKILIKFIGETVYWRVYWLFPIGITLAYCFTKAIFSLQGKLKTALCTISVLVIIVMGGKLIYMKPFFQEVNNRYKIPDDVLAIINVISADKEEYKKVAGPEPFVVFTRQIDGTILTDLYRNLNGIYGEKTLLSRINRGEVEEVASLAKIRKCNYIVYLTDFYREDDNLEDYGFKYVTQNPSYTLFKLDNE